MIWGSEHDRQDCPGCTGYPPGADPVRDRTGASARGIALQGRYVGRIQKSLRDAPCRGAIYRLSESGLKD